MAVEGFYHSYKGHFGCIGNKRKDGSIEATADCLYEFGHYIGAESLALTVDIGVATAGKIHPLERATLILALRQNTTYLGSPA